MDWTKCVASATQCRLLDGQMRKDELLQVE